MKAHQNVTRAPEKYQPAITDVLWRDEGGCCGMYLEKACFFINMTRKSRLDRCIVYPQK